MANDNAPAVYASGYMEESDLNARGQSVLGHTEPIQHDSDIESTLAHEKITLLVMTSQVRGCCKNSCEKECCGGFCLSGIVTASVNQSNGNMKMETCLHQQCDFLASKTGFNVPTMLNWATVLADTGTCLLVIMNMMLLLRGRYKHRHVQKCSRRSCGAPKEHKCIASDISSNQNHRKCCNEKNRYSSILPQVHTLSPCDAKSTARLTCCESMKCISKQKRAEQKVSWEPRSCSSVQKSTRECHPSQFTANESEIIKIASSVWKQGCSTGNSAVPSRAHSKTCGC
ncbi:hypothetical protein CDL15_Pgr027077 [Punica granatum]|uniref:Uncharacterized protein n=1 Tax=Punica granatum TaxID=22663 RepID=A0A218XHM1_PUNGR|nr:hypothetical protein CDL15_Pgr027077 [Punica granatum]